MILIGETIHIISQTVNQAVKERNPKPIQDLATAQAEAGAHYIDVNLGPARKDPEATTEWLVKTVQEVTDLPLSIDTLNPVAMEAGLKVCKICTEKGPDWASVYPHDTRTGFWEQIPRKQTE